MSDKQNTPADGKPPEVLEIWAQFGTTMERIGEIDPGALPFLKTAISDHTPSHGNSEKVVVLNVDEKIVAGLLEEGTIKKMIEAADTFRNALEASHVLGYTYNAVSLALSKERNRQIVEADANFGKGNYGRLRPEVTLRGVTLQYEKDVRDL